MTCPGGAGDAAQPSQRAQPAKTMLSGSGLKLEIAVPRDRQANFEPQLIARNTVAAFPISMPKVISLFARGLSMREFGGLLREL